MTGATEGCSPQARWRTLSRGLRQPRPAQLQSAALARGVADVPGHALFLARNRCAGREGRQHPSRHPAFISRRWRCRRQLCMAASVWRLSAAHPTRVAAHSTVATILPWNRAPVRQTCDDDLAALEIDRSGSANHATGRRHAHRMLAAPLAHPLDTCRGHLHTAEMSVATLARQHAPCVNT
jgi:hypothetical protein